MIPKWEVEAYPGGPVIALNGTIQEVRNALIKLNPSWDIDYPDRNISRRDATIEARRDTQFNLYNCFGRWPGTNRGPIVDGIRYLRRTNGRPTEGPGPGKCSRVSCSYNAAIYWCNDVSSSISQACHWTA